MTNLFETPEKLPKKIQAIINKKEIETYKDCKQLLIELNKHGYTFDYGLDAVPFDLRKIRDKMTNEQLSALKDVHECTQHNTGLLLPRSKYKKAFKELESEGYIYAMKFNTYCIRLTVKGMEKCIELVQKREF